MNPADVVLVLLAAGEARRFGGDKLMADLAGRPVAAHAVAALAPIGFRERIAVVSRTGFDIAEAGYRVVRNERPEDGLSRSLRLGIAVAGECTAVLVALADMPLVGTALIARLLEAADGRRHGGCGDGRYASQPAGGDRRGALCRSSTAARRSGRAGAAPLRVSYPGRRQPS